MPRPARVRMAVALALSACVMVVLSQVAVAHVRGASRDLAHGGIGAPSDDPVPTPETLAFRCWPEVREHIEPEVLLLGERAELSATLSIAPLCHGGGWPRHTVLVLTGMEARGGPSRAVLLDRLRELVDDTRTNEATSMRMGVVVVDEDRARTVLPITGNRDSVHAAVRRWYLEARGTPLGVSAALRESRSALDRAIARLPAHDYPTPGEIVIVVGDIGGGADCPVLSRDARLLKDSGVLVITLCYTPGCVSACHASVATSRRYAIPDPYWYDLRSIYRVLANVDMNIVPRRVDVEVRLNDTFDYVADTASPAPTSSERRRLYWSTGRVVIPRSGVTFTFGVRSTVDAPGRHPIAARAIVSVWSNIDYPDYVVHRSIPSWHLLVLRPRSWPAP